MTTTINADLSSITMCDEGVTQLKLPNYNTITLEPFTSEAEVHAHIADLASNPNAFVPIPNDQVISVSPVEFKMLFTSTERIAIRAARDDVDPANAPTKAVLDDWFDIVDDPRLTEVDLTLQSTQDGITFLETIGILTAARKQQVMEGQIQ